MHLGELCSPLASPQLPAPQFSSSEFASPQLAPHFHSARPSVLPHLLPHSAAPPRILNSPCHLNSAELLRLPDPGSHPVSSPNLALLLIPSRPAEKRSFCLTPGYCLVGAFEGPSSRCRVGSSVRQSWGALESPQGGRAFGCEAPHAQGAGAGRGNAEACKLLQELPELRVGGRKGARRPGMLRPSGGPWPGLHRGDV